MPFDTTHSTLTLGEPLAGEAADVGNFLCWVFPLPVLAPSWLDGRRVVLGRDPKAGIRLPSEQVSRQHAAIVRSGPLFIVSDLGSKNGVFVNGRAVSEAALTLGDTVRLGDMVGVLTRAPRGEPLELASAAPGLYGGHALRAFVTQLRELAATDLPIVLEGETGTGKETLCRLTHEWSGRSGPLVTLSCAVYSPATAAAELFGYRQGAMPGAQRPSLGHVRAAEGGTIVLDELADLATGVQAMLVRVIEQREVLPLGEERPCPVDVRFVISTQTALDVADPARLRQDLRARLDRTRVHVPALRECREIVPALFSLFYEKHTGSAPVLNAACVERLCSHDWPLNVREIDTLASRLAVSHQPGRPLDVIVLESTLGLAPSERARPASTRSKPADLSIPGRDALSPYKPDEVEALIEALGRHAGNLSRAAVELRISRQKAYRMVEAARAAGLLGTGKPSGS